MLERIGPIVWDRIGPGIAAKYWDDPAKKEDGHLCYSAIDRAATASAWQGFVLAALMTPIGILATWAMLNDPKVWNHGAGSFTVIICLIASGLSVWKLVGDIRWTQLAPTMAADGLCDDLFIEDDDEEDDIQDDADEIDGDLPDEDLAADNVVLVDDDDWGRAS